MAKNLFRVVIIFSGIAFILVSYVWAQEPQKQRIRGEELDSFIGRIAGVNELIPKETRGKTPTTANFPPL